MNGKKLNVNSIMGIIGVIIGSYIYFVPSKAIRNLNFDLLGASFFPKMASIIIIVSSFGLFFWSFFTFHESKAQKNIFKYNNEKKAFVFFIILFLYTYFLSKVGHFVLLTTIFIMLNYIILSKYRNTRNIILGIVFSFTSSCAVWLLFTKGFNQILP